MAFNREWDQGSRWGETAAVCAMQMPKALLDGLGGSARDDLH